MLRTVDSVTCWNFVYISEKSRSYFPFDSGSSFFGKEECDRRNTLRRIKGLMNVWQVATQLTAEQKENLLLSCGSTQVSNAQADNKLNLLQIQEFETWLFWRMVVSNVLDIIYMFCDNFGFTKCTIACGFSPQAIVHFHEYCSSA